MRRLLAITLGAAQVEEQFRREAFTLSMFASVQSLPSGDSGSQMSLTGAALALVSSTLSNRLLFSSYPLIAFMLQS